MNAPTYLIKYRLLHKQRNNKISNDVRVVSTILCKQNDPVEHCMLQYFENYIVAQLLQTESRGNIFDKKNSKYPKFLLHLVYSCTGNFHLDLSTDTIYHS